MHRIFRDKQTGNQVWRLCCTHLTVVPLQRACPIYQTSMKYVTLCLMISPSLCHKTVTNLGPPIGNVCPTSEQKVIK